ncbi:MAG: hypothetical protein LUC43_09460 [Burkholderiales bacterium]|nr:hypothetical protein [Burkholderiales bacterium]
MRNFFLSVSIFFLSIVYANSYADSIKEFANRELTEEDVKVIRLVNYDNCQKDDADSCYNLGVYDLVLCVVANDLKETFLYFDEAFDALEKSCQLSNDNGCKLLESLR